MDPRVPHGPHGWEDHSLSVLPLIGNFVFLLLILALVATGLYLWRTGRLPLGNLGRARPEEEAKRILIDLVYLSLQNNPVIGATTRERPGKVE